MIVRVLRWTMELHEPCCFSSEPAKTLLLLFLAIQARFKDTFNIFAYKIHPSVKRKKSSPNRRPFDRQRIPIASNEDEWCFLGVNDDLVRHEKSFVQFMQLWYLLILFLRSKSLIRVVHLIYLARRDRRSHCIDVCLLLIIRIIEAHVDRQWRHRMHDRCSRVSSLLMLKFWSANPRSVKNESKARFWVVKRDSLHNCAAHYEMSIAINYDFLINIIVECVLVVINYSASCCRL